jgi:AMP-binding enzyme C-terminal domain
MLSERGFEVIKASLVLARGQQLTRETLIAHCRRALAEYKVPRIVEMVHMLPENLMGKRVAGVSDLLLARRPVGAVLTYVAVVHTEGSSEVRINATRANHAEDSMLPCVGHSAP